MNLLYVADGRSPTTQSWIANLQADGHRVSLISSYPCEKLSGLAEFYILPIAFSGMAANPRAIRNSTSSAGLLHRVVKTIRPSLLQLRYLIGPLTLPFYRNQFLKIVDYIGPELIHALRIPFEGMLAQTVSHKYPLVVSIWGNDLTLHAQRSYRMGKSTQVTLSRADGLMADAYRDIRLAKSWGFTSERPSLVAPGSGGIDIAAMEKARVSLPKYLIDIIPPDRKLVVNPRGLRPGSLRTDVFFDAARLVSSRHPEVMFLCPAMSGQPEAEQMVKARSLEAAVRLLPSLPQHDLWWLFSRADVVVSPGEHDGVPNSLLEAMAVGGYPIAGDIESLREWITPGVNGLLYPPADPVALAEAILLVLDNPDRQLKTARVNRGLIRDRADVTNVRKKVTEFYQRVSRL
jgi:glycosyltransferase involved in cell wall biosynthesis